ncbi:MAG: PIN domain-containing protein [Gammaproteobacteria bacterium]|nr:PIN domain-containing protein [Gammaproteobacteria bacterium]
MSEDKKEIFFDHWVFPDAKSLFSFRLKTLEEVKNDCIIVLDTNILLFPYKLNSQGIELIKLTYRELIAQKRLFIPGQVAREFAKNRALKITEIHNRLLQKKGEIKNIDIGNYSVLEGLQVYQEILQEQNLIDDHIKKIKSKIDNLVEHISSWNYSDPVGSIYNELFEENVIFDIELNEDAIKKDYERRCCFDIPPGYKDKNKKGNSSGGIGDLIIWDTILEIGRVHKKDVLFVTSDEKSDWWYRSQNKNLFPRYELIDEFRRASDGKSLYMVELSDLLRLFDVNEQFVEEVRIKEQNPKITITFYVGSDHFHVDNQEFSLSVAPYEKDGCIFVPVIPIALAIGVKENNIIWETKNGRMTFIWRGRVIQITAKSKELVINAYSIQMDVEPDFVNGQVMLPIRFVAQAFGLTASWDEMLEMIRFVLEE